jgi:hypothetical protein
LLKWRDAIFADPELHWFHEADPEPLGSILPSTISSENISDKLFSPKILDKFPTKTDVE